MSPKFRSGAKVFAKVRGYPPWPARIEGCADETPNKMKYHVYFYGTGETAVVKTQDVFDFVENRNKMGKLKKHKNFTEAMQQIEKELSPEQKAAIAALGVDDGASPAVTPGQDTPKEKAAKISNEAGESGTPGTRRASTSTKTPKPTPTSTKPAPKDAKRKLETDSSTEDPTPKKLNTGAGGTPTPSTNTDKTNEGTSRSGRKIKPKKFSDQEDNDDSKDQSMASPPKEEEKKPKDAKRPTPRPKSFKPTEEATNDSGSGDWYLLATRGKTKISINLKCNRPTFEDNQKRNMTVSEWENLVFNEARTLKKQIESGNSSMTEEEANNHMERFTKVKAATVHLIRSPEEDVQFRKEHYDVESSMLDIEMQIRSALSLKGADTKACITQLDRLKKLRITALMLKKHPQIVRTVRKLRRYIGNTIRWNMNEQETEDFNRDAEKIRAKSEEIVNNFKSLFFQPSSGSFWDHFSNELTLFNLKTKNMTMEQIFAIITEPE